MFVARLSRILGSKVGSKRFMSSIGGGGGGAGGGGRKPPFKIPPSAHYIDADEQQLLRMWLLALQQLGKDKKTYAVKYRMGTGANSPVEERRVFLHVTNKGGEEAIMNKGLNAAPGAYTAAAVRAHTVSNKEPEQNVPKAIELTPKMMALYTMGGSGLEEAENHDVPQSQYYFVTNVKAQQEHDGAMTGIEWAVATLQVVAWLMRFADGTFAVGGELAKKMDKDGKSPKK